VLDRQPDGTFLVFGAQVPTALRAAEILRRDHGLRVGVINARFVKPLDEAVILQTLTESPFVVTVEEGCLMGGFGAAVLELANAHRIDTRHVTRLGLPDRFIMHAERDEQLAEVGLDVEGLVRAALEAARAAGFPSHPADLMSAPTASANHQAAGLAAGPAETAMTTI